MKRDTYRIQQIGTSGLYRVTVSLGDGHALVMATGLPREAAIKEAAHYERAERADRAALLRTGLADEAVNSIRRAACEYVE